MCEQKDKSFWVLMSEPLPNITPEQWLVQHANCDTERDLANAFAGAWNEARWLEDETYDKNCLKETEERYNLWSKLVDKLEERILQIYKRDYPDTDITNKPSLFFIVPIMVRNGYEMRNGWWAFIQPSDC